MLYAIGTILVLYLFCIMPRIMRRPDYTAFKDSNFAHRGFHNIGLKRPENSLGAFKTAIELGYGIEIDIQLTKDQKVVVFHDFDLKRVCGVDQMVCELTYEELQKLYLFDSNEKIPLFSDLLELVDGKVPLLIELKCKNGKDRIAPEADKILAGYKGTYYIQSFHPLALRWYKKNRPNVIRGQLAECYEGQKELGKSVAFFLQQHLIFNVLCRPDFISYNWKHGKEWSLNICKYIYKSPLAAWTIRSKEEYEKARHKFDVKIFEKFYL